MHATIWAPLPVCICSSSRSLQFRSIWESERFQLTSSSLPVFLPGRNELRVQFQLALVLLYLLSAIRCCHVSGLGELRDKLHLQTRLSLPRGRPKCVDQCSGEEEMPVGSSYAATCQICQACSSIRPHSFRFCPSCKGLHLHARHMPPLGLQLFVQNLPGSASKSGPEE